MKILIACLSFQNLTGSELYFYELSKQLVKLGHHVSILSQVKDGKLYKKAANNGVKVFDFTIAPKAKFDIILASHQPVIQALIDNPHYKDTPIISINHSEVIPLEFPVIHERIMHYIAIRSEIKTMMEDRYFIDPAKTSLVYNPVNDHKFTYLPYEKPERKTVLFIGTIDPLRKATLLDLVKRSKEEDFDLVVVGEKFDTYLDDAGITVHTSTWDVEKYYRKATHTASIMLGRTTIEGWYYGLPSYIYKVNKAGDLQSMDIVNAPSDMSIFNSKNVAQQIIDIITPYADIKTNNAIFLHLYYHDQWDDIATRLKKFPGKFNLYVNLIANSEGVQEIIDKIVASFPNVKISFAPNRGMDIGGQLNQMHNWIKHGGDEEFLFFIHSKKGSETDDATAEQWRNRLFEVIAPEKYELVKSKFADSSVGMVGNWIWLIRDALTGYEMVKDDADNYAKAFGLNNISINKFDFIGGTMFGVRSKIYRDFFTKYPPLDIANELEPGFVNNKTGSTKTHAMERVFGWIVTNAGYKIEGI